MPCISSKKDSKDNRDREPDLQVESLFGLPVHRGPNRAGCGKRIINDLIPQYKNSQIVNAEAEAMGMQDSKDKLIPTLKGRWRG